MTPDPSEKLKADEAWSDRFPRGVKLFAYLTHLSSAQDADEEIRKLSRADLESIVLSSVLSYQQKALPPDEYGPWSRVLPPEDADNV